MSKKLTLEITPGLDGRKIESLLENELSVSRSLIAKLKRTDGGVLLNGESAMLVARVKTGDTLLVNIPEGGAGGIVGTKMELDILFEDEDVLAVNKPGDMPVHPSGKHEADTLMNGVIHYLGESGECHIITRLDRDTTGVVLIAKNAHSAKLLTEEMKKGGIEKEYVAMVEGVPSPEKGEICAPIKKAEEKGIKRIVSESGKEALSLYEIIETDGETSLVRLVPVTGRTHQLRVHLSYIGHPIVGDRMYGAKTGERTMLRCRKIRFIHPLTKEEVTICANTKI